MLAYVSFPSFTNSDSRVIPSKALVIFLETGLKFISRACLEREREGEKERDLGQILLSSSSSSSSKP